MCLFLLQDTFGNFRKGGIKDQSAEVPGKLDIGVDTPILDIEDVHPIKSNFCIGLSCNQSGMQCYFNFTFICQRTKFTLFYHTCEGK